jgi:diguanylate cyclase (GGDEF)-like protein
MFEQLKEKADNWQNREQSEPIARDTLLLQMQVALIPLLSFTVILFALLGGGALSGFCLYTALAAFAALSLCVWLNLKGRYMASLLVTLAVVFAATWLYALYGLLVAQGSPWLLLYLAVPLLILSQFAPLRVTLPVTAAHLLGMGGLMWAAGGAGSDKWIIWAFCVMLSALCILINHQGRQQSERALSSINMSEAAERTLRDVSMHDPLTGLYNRRHLEESLRGYTRAPAQPFTILMVDLDHFKSINDLYGHIAGDTVLQQVAGILSVNHRPTDIACRYGGDEFIVILINCALRDGIRKAEVIKTQIAALTPTDREERRIQVTASIGVAHFPENGGDRDTILKIVDQMMYMAKQEGRNRVVAALASR